MRRYSISDISGYCVKYLPRPAVQTHKKCLQNSSHLSAHHIHIENLLFVCNLKYFCIIYCHIFDIIPIAYNNKVCNDCTEIKFWHFEFKFIFLL